MTVPTSVSRKQLIRELMTRSTPISTRAIENGGTPGRVSEYFGINTFGHRQMRDKLPKDVYAKLIDAIRHGKKLDAEIEAIGVAHRIATRKTSWLAVDEEIVATPGERARHDDDGQRRDDPAHLLRLQPGRFPGPARHSVQGL
jgi:hypothetical protein